MAPASLTVTGHLDGACVRNGGEVVAVFPNTEVAWAALRAAQQAAEPFNPLASKEA